MVLRPGGWRRAPHRLSIGGSGSASRSKDALPANQSAPGTTKHGCWRQTRNRHSMVSHLARTSSCTTSKLSLQPGAKQPCGSCWPQQQDRKRMQQQPCCCCGRGCWHSDTDVQSQLRLAHSKCAHTFLRRWRQQLRQQRRLVCRPLTCRGDAPVAAGVAGGRRGGDCRRRHCKKRW